MALTTGGASLPTPTQSSPLSPPLLQLPMQHHPVLASAGTVGGACDSELGGHLKKCVSCGKLSHELCGADVQHKFPYYICVCLAWQRLLTGLVLQCPQYTCTINAHCTTMIGEAIHCKACASPHHNDHHHHHQHH